MRYPLKPNHLAKIIDHQRFAAYKLPSHLSNKCRQLAALTDEARAILEGCLPDEILDTMLIGNYENGKLTLCITSQTAANHLRYQSDNLTRILKEQSFTFGQLNHIDVITAYPTSINHLSEINQPSAQDIRQSNSSDDMTVSHNLQGLSESTKATIAYTAEHVIKDARLKRLLNKLARS